MLSPNSDGWSYLLYTLEHVAGELKPKEFLFPTPVRDVFTYLVTLLLIRRACGFKYVSTNLNTIILVSWIYLIAVVTVAKQLVYF